MFGAFKGGCVESAISIVAEKEKEAAKARKAHKKEQPVNLTFADLGRMINGRSTDPPKNRPFSWHFSHSAVDSAWNAVGAVGKDGWVTRQSLSHRKVRAGAADAAEPAPAAEQPSGAADAGGPAKRLRSSRPTRSSSSAARHTPSWPTPSPRPCRQSRRPLWRRRLQRAHRSSRRSARPRCSCPLRCSSDSRPPSAMPSPLEPSSTSGCTARPPSSP